MFDARAKLDSKKRIYKSVRGIELDLTFRPFGISKLGTEYTDLYFKCVETTKEYKSKKESDLKEEDVNKLQKVLKDYTEKGKEIILMALAVNDQTYDEKWLNNNLVTEEFSLLINYILKEEETDEKKTNSSDGNQTQ